MIVEKRVNQNKITSNSNPFIKQNPYKIKNKFTLSVNDRKKYHKVHINEQSIQNKLKYNKRQYDSLNHENSQYQSHSLTKSYNNNNNNNNANLSQNHRVNYELDYKRYLQNKYCPSDKYLNLIRQQHLDFDSKQNSSFLMMTKISGKRFSLNKYYQEDQLIKNNHNKNILLKQNPFYRKNLLQFSKVSQSTTTNSIQYQYQLTRSKVYSQVLAYEYGDFYQTNKCCLYDFVNEKQLKQIDDQVKGESCQRKNMQKREKSPKNQLSMSFGGKKGQQFSGLILGHLKLLKNKPSQIQKNAPKCIQIKGIKFYLNKVEQL